MQLQKIDPLDARAAILPLTAFVDGSRLPEEFAVALKGAFPALSQMRTYWHNWTDRNGVSHMTRCEMYEFKLQSISKPADPQWHDRQSPSGATIIITVQPPHWNGTWHENPTVRTWAKSEVSRS